MFLSDLAAAIGIISFVALLLGGAAWLGVRAAANGLLLPLLVGAGLRLAVMLAAHIATIGSGLDGTFFPDDLGFTSIGAGIADPWVHGQIINVSSAAYAGTINYGFQALVGAVFVFVGTSVLAVKFVNVLIGCATIILTGLIGKRLFGELGKRRAAWTMALLPTAVWWSSVMLKEALTTFLVAAAVLAVINRPRLATLVAFAVALVALLLTRPAGAAALTIAAVLAYAIAGWRGRRELDWRVIGRNVATLVGIALIASLILSSGDPAGPIRQLEGTARSMSDLYHGGSIASVPIDTPKSLVAPYPWVFTAATDNWDRALYPGMWFLFAILPTAALGVWRLRRSTELVILVVPIAISLTIYAVTSGAAFRQRSMIEPLIVLLFVAGIDSWRGVARRAAAAFALAAVLAGIQSASPVVALTIGLAAAALFLASTRLPGERSPVPMPRAVFLEGLTTLGPPRIPPLRTWLTRARRAAPPVAAATPPHLRQPRA